MVCLPGKKTVRQQQGDPRFLELVHRAINSRRALLGLDARHSRPLLNQPAFELGQSPEVRSVRAHAE